LIQKLYSNVTNQNLKVKKSSITPPTIGEVKDSYVYKEKIIILPEPDLPPVVITVPEPKYKKPIPVDYLGTPINTGGGGSTGGGGRRDRMGPEYGRDYIAEDANRFDNYK
jgi:hypothetical protein